jgi:RNA polymerase sigma-70 factor (ECF subfamily)
METTPCAASRPEPRALEDLIPAGCGGDRLALGHLIERYQFRMARFVLAQTRDPNTVEDLCQTGFVKMVINLPQLRDVSRFESWLFQIARNVCRDHLRAALGWRRYFVPYDAAYEGVAMSEAATGESKLDDGIAQLTPEDRALLRLHLEEKKSYGELAHLSNTSVSAIKSRLYRARRELLGFLFAGDSE